MTEEVAPAAEPAAEPAIAEITAPQGTEFKISTSDAARILSQARAARFKPDNKTPVAEPPVIEAEPAREPAADAAEAPVAETSEAAEAQTSDANPAEDALPPIEPPRSWTTEEKDAFRALPRSHQERIAERERARDTDIGRRQNEASEKAKAAEAERQAMAEARSKYEAALPQLAQALMADPEWADIKTQADVERMVNEDWPRAVKWQFHQQKVAAVQQELQQAQQRQQMEAKQKWQDFSTREDAAFLEKAPDLRDPAKASKMREAAVSLLKEIGFSEQELSGLWESPALRDHRMQLMLLKAVQLEEAKKAALNATKKPLPPVQRPGVAQPNKGRDDVLADLSAKIDRTSGINQTRAAAAFIAARRAANRS